MKKQKRFMRCPACGNAVDTTRIVKHHVSSTGFNKERGMYCDIYVILREPHMIECTGEHGCGSVIDKRNGKIFKIGGRGILIGIRSI